MEFCSSDKKAFRITAKSRTALLQEGENDVAERDEPYIVDPMPHNRIL